MTDTLPAPILLGASTSPDALTVTYTLGTRALTGEHPTPRALLILFDERTEAARLLLGAPLAQLVPDLLEAFPALPRIHPAALAEWLRAERHTLIYPVPGLPDAPALFATEQDAKHAGDTLAALPSAARNLFSGEGGEALEGAEAAAGAALFALLGAALEDVREPEPINPEDMN